MWVCTTKAVSSSGAIRRLWYYTLCSICIQQIMYKEHSEMFGYVNHTGTPFYTVCSIHCTDYSVQCTVYIVHRSLYSVHRSIQYIVYIV